MSLSCFSCSNDRTDFLCPTCFEKGFNAHDSIVKLNQSLIQHEPNQSILTKQSIQLDTHKLIHRLQSIQDLVESKESLIKQSNKSILTLIDTYYFKDKERNEQLIEKNSETRKRIQRLDALSKEVSVRHLASIDQIHLNTQTIQHSIIQYQRKAIQELIKIFRLRKYKKNDKTEEYRIASTGFQITNLKGEDEQQVDAAIGYMMQFVSVLSKYLNFEVPAIRLCPASSSSTIIVHKRTFKLYTAGNKEFMGALGVLNYFILCLGEFAHIGRLLPENTLENIVKLCLEYGNGTQVQSDQKADLFFDYELDNVMRDMCDNHFVLI